MRKVCGQAVGWRTELSREVGHERRVELKRVEIVDKTKFDQKMTKKEYAMKPRPSFSD